MYIKNSRTIGLAATFLIMMFYQLAVGQGGVYFGEKEVTPKIPPKGERMRILIVSHATNEIDDVLAIALAILSPERFDIEAPFMLNNSSTQII